MVIRPAFFYYIVSMVISASRRCDIPRFRLGWLTDRAEAGFVETINPFNAAQKKRISLKPEDVEFIVYWTRDPCNLAESPILKKFPGFYIMITLTNYPAILEPDMPPADQVIRSMESLSQGFGSNRIVWRYDPIILTSVTDYKFHLKNFSDLASRLSGITERVIVSIYDEYTGAIRRFNDLFQKNGLRVFPHYSPEKHLLLEITELVSQLFRIAADCGIEIQSCAEEQLSVQGIKKGACIDGELIKKILGKDVSAVILERDKNQRPGCGCIAAADIGSYGVCPAGCVYCYARR